MLWYEYRQNNSGGVYCGPAINVFIEATNEDVAAALAERLGVYFDGCSTGADCDCCGDRWYRAYNGDEEKPKPYDFDMDRGVAVALYVYDNGKTVDFVGVPDGLDTQKISQKLLT